MDAIVLTWVVGSAWTSAALALLLRWRGMSPDLISRVSTFVTGSGFAAAIGAGILLATAGSSTASTGLALVQLDPLAVLLSLLVLGLSAIIQSFARRYLRGDPRQTWFVISANLLTGFTVLLVCAETLVVFSTAWVGSGLSLLALLGTYAHLEQARVGVQRLARRLLIGDALLLVGVAVLLVAGGGDQRLDQLAAVASSLPDAVAIGVASLLTVGALARSSQIPFQGWLPYTLAAPTPVSAMLHAGVVNAGGILLVRFSPVIADQLPVMIGIVIVGSATLVFASAARLVRPDVKGRLVYSTMAQMGFMIMACGFGAFSAAIFHLIAHSLFKSFLFLGAGTVVQDHSTDRDLPAPEPLAGVRRVAAVAFSVLLPVAALIAAVALLDPGVAQNSIGLLAFVATTLAITLAAVLTTRVSAAVAVLSTVATVAVIFAYTAFAETFSVVDPSVDVSPAPFWLFALPVIGLVVVEVLSRNRGPGAMRDRAYAGALTAALPRLVSAKGAPA